MKVFWVESFDHSEDWFVVAQDLEAAVMLFANEMGFDIFNDEISATEVCDAPPGEAYTRPDFLDNPGVIACGGEFVEFHDQDILQHVPEEYLKIVGGETRIVRLNNKVYMEGNVLRVALQLEGKLTNS